MTEEWIKKMWHIYIMEYNSALGKNVLLFTIAKTWKQPKCPSTEEWIKKMWETYNGILLSH